MKQLKFFSAALVLAVLAFSACNIIPEAPDGPGHGPVDTIPSVGPGIDPPAPTFDWSQVQLPEGAELITVAKAREIGTELGNGGVSKEKYYICGIVKKFANKHASGIADFGNALFFMVDNEGDSEDFEAYQVYNVGNKKFTSEDEISIGDHVVVYGFITNYSGTIETTGKGAAYIYWTDHK